jgi:hypothetical protein
MPYRAPAYQPAGHIHAPGTNNHFATADPESPAHDVLHRMLNELFAAGLDLHRALQLIDHDTAQARHVETAVTRLDDTITTLLHTALPARQPTTGTGARGSDTS